MAPNAIITIASKFFVIIGTEFSVPFLCVITPVFDDCLAAFKLLVEALQHQTCEDFIHVAISNGKSTAIQEWLSELKDPRFIYEEFPAEPTTNLVLLLTNLGKRRNHCLKKYEADRFVFLDADLQIIDTAYFQKLCNSHWEAPIILTRVKHGPTTLPKFPITLGNIDISNYSFNREIAKKIDYPTDVSFALYRYANDFRFYDSIGMYPHKILSDVCSIKDGNKYYTRVSDLMLTAKHPK